MERFGYLVWAFFAFGLESFILAIANGNPHAPPAEYCIITLIVVLDVVIAGHVINRGSPPPKETPSPRAQPRPPARCAGKEPLAEPALERPPLSSPEKARLVGCLGIWAATIVASGAAGVFALWGWWYRYVEHPIGHASGMPLSRLLMLPMIAAVAASYFYAAYVLGQPLVFPFWLATRPRREEALALWPDESGTLDLRSAKLRPWAGTPEPASVPAVLPEELPMEVIKLLDSRGELGNSLTRERLVSSGEFVPLWDRRGGRNTLILLAIFVAVMAMLVAPFGLRAIKPWGSALIPACISLGLLIAIGGPFSLLWVKKIAARNRRVCPDLEFLAELPPFKPYSAPAALAVRRAMASLASVAPEIIRANESPDSYDVFSLGRPLLIEFAALLCEQPNFRSDPVGLARALAVFPRDSVADLAAAVAASGYYLAQDERG